jgi:hypothetical protein
MEFEKQKLALKIFIFTEDENLNIEVPTYIPITENRWERRFRV